MSPDVDPFAEDDAAYVMGALSDEQRRAFEAHLADCPACTTSVAELSGMTALLDKVAVERVLQPQLHEEQLPELSLPRLLKAARSERRRRAAWQVASGAVAASVIALAVVLGLTLPGQPEPAGVAVAMQPARSAPVTGKLLVTPVDWGTKITLDCRWVEGSAAAASDDREVYRLVVVPRDGSTPQVLAQWAVWPGEDATVVGSTELAADQIRSFEVTAVSAADEVLLRAKAPSGPSTA
jgi:hypothetical protein